MDKNQLRQFLQMHEDGGIAALHAQGYQWFKSAWSKRAGTPRIHLGEQLRSQHTELLAECWYLIGDVHDFNGAPLQAIQAYQQCLAFDETVDGAYRELAYQYEVTGQYAKAAEHVQRALDLLAESAQADPELLPALREELLDLQESIQDSMAHGLPPFVPPSREAWLLSEQLAKEDFKAVVKTVTALDQPDSTLLQRLAQAQAALEQYDAYVRTWQRIAQQNDAIAITYADWFYLPAAVADRPDFWTVWQQLTPRVESLELTQHWSLEEAYGDRLSAAELMRLVVVYHHAVCTHNSAGLHALQQQYPNWDMAVG